MIITAAIARFVDEPINSVCPIRRGLRNVSRSDHAGGADPVFQQHGPAPEFRKPWGDDSCNGVGLPAGA